jgi:hypothetical protein
LSGTIGRTGHRDGLPRDLIAGRSFVVASNPPRNEQRALERAIEERGGSVHPFLNAVTDVLVIGLVTGNDSEARWAREQIRRGEVYRQRWGHLELITVEELRAALRKSPGGSG